MKSIHCCTLTPFLRSFPLFLLSLSCRTAIAPDKALLDLSREPPLINTRPGPEYADQVRSGNVVLGIERTPNGRLRACWVGNGDNPNGFFTLAECRNPVGDAIEQTVTWAKVSNPSALAGRPLRLRFVLQDANLYSIQFNS